MYRPLPIYLTVRKSKIHGLGIFAVSDIPQGFDLGVAHVRIDGFPHGYCRTPLGGFYNHSEDPNCKLIGENIKRLVAIKDITEGGEITCRYTLYPMGESDEQTRRKGGNCSSG